MLSALRFRSALLRSTLALAASACGPAFGQALPPGAMPVAPGMTGGDPFAGGAYAVPTAGPVAVAYGDPATLNGGTVMSMPADGSVVSGPTASGGPVYMAPQVIGSQPMMGSPDMSGMPQMMGSPMPGSPGCNCGPGGAPMGGSMMMDPSMMGMPMGAPAYGAPMGGPVYGGMSPGCDDGCCLTGGGCCLDSLCGTAVSPCDPCQSGVPICDPCQATPGVCPPGGGLYQSMGGRPRCGWSTGFSWVFLKPYYSSNAAFSTTTGGVFGTTETEGFDHSFDLSPRVFVEKVFRSDWGIRATWFGYENDSDVVSAVVPAGGFGATQLGQLTFGGNTLAAQSAFDFDTIDIDATQRFQVRRSLINVGGGVRWLGYEHDYRSIVSGPAIVTSTGSATRQFDGIGPTVFAEWRRPIGSTRFSLLASVRGALLYGESETETLLTNVGGIPGLATASRSEADDFVATGETQLGGEWSAWIGDRTVLFAQVAYEAQALLGVGTALDANDDLGLHGFNTKVGLEW